MKKLFSCILAILILAISVVPCFAENEGTGETEPVNKSASLSVSASSTSVNVGDTISVTVKVSEGLGTINLTVSYKSDYFEYVSSSLGSVFPSCEGTPGSGTFRVVGFENTSGAGGTIATLSLKVLKTSSGSEGKISVSATGRDVDENSVTISGSSVTVACAHKDVEEKVIEPSTCDKFGKSEKKCKSCGKTEYGEIEKINHTYGEWEIVVMPSEYTPGEQRRECINCHFVEKKAVTINGETPEEPETDPEIELPSYPFYQEEGTEPNNTPIPKPNNNGNYRPEQKDDEENTEKKGLFALFASSSDASDSDKAAVLVVALAVVIVIVLVIYLLLLKQRKKK